MACLPDFVEPSYPRDSSREAVLLEGGFDDSLFVNPPSPSQGFHCPVCLLVLKDPHLLSCCGKHLCQVCVKRIKASGQDCPCCRTADFHTLLNKEKRGRVLELKVHCSNSESGCGWTGELGDVTRHLNTRCSYVKEACQYGCGGMYPRSVLQVHQRDECANRPVEVKLESFMRLTTEKMRAQEKEMAELKLKVKEHEKRLEAERNQYMLDKKKMSQQIEELGKQVKQLNSREETIKVFLKRGVWRLLHSPVMEKKWSEFVGMMKEKAVSIVSSSKSIAQSPFVKFKGEHEAVAAMKSKMLELQSSVKKERINLARPGIVQYFFKDPNGQVVLKGVENEVRVCIELEMKEDVAGDYKVYSPDSAKLHFSPIEVLHPVPSLDEEDDWEDLVLTQSVLASATLNSEVTLCVYGATAQSVKRAEKRLRAIIDTHFITEEIEHQNVTMLSESEVVDLKKIARRHRVDIEIDCDPDIHTIKLHGCQGDVLKVKDKVRDVLSEMNQLKAREEAAIAVFKHVKWVRQYSEEEEDYSEMFSYEIEQAYQRNNKGFYKSTSAVENFTINFSKMEETDLDSGDVCRVQRIDFSEVEKPPDWVAMPKDSQGREVHSHLVVLKPGCPEFNNVSKRFDATMKGRYKQIVSIERLQNPLLYGQYTARKKEMEKKNPTGCKNERWVFHGTSPDTINHINTQGFNRSFKGKNGIAYGQGVYFARDASYSNGYATPDATGHRYMYLTRVLTGEYTTGRDTMIVPPAKNPQVLFDSTVDNQASPTIFVVYTDSQSYPAYLIKYT